MCLKFELAIAQVLPTVGIIEMSCKIAIRPQGSFLSDSRYFLSFGVGHRQEWTIPELMSIKGHAQSGE
jgi:hypothetical protein